MLHLPDLCLINFTLYGSIVRSHYSRHRQLPLLRHIVRICQLQDRLQQRQHHKKLKILLLYFLYNFTAAILQPLGNSRMTALLEQTAGSFMLLFAEPLYF